MSKGNENLQIKRPTRCLRQCAKALKTRNPKYHAKSSSGIEFLFGAGSAAVSPASPRIRCSSSSSGSKGDSGTLAGGGGFGRRRRSHPNRLKDYPGLIVAQRLPLSPSLHVLPEINPIAEDPWRGLGRGGRWRCCASGERKGILLTRNLVCPRLFCSHAAGLLDSRSRRSKARMHDCVSAIRFLEPFPCAGRSAIFGHSSNLSRPCGVRFTELAATSD